MTFSSSFEQLLFDLARADPLVIVSLKASMNTQFFQMLLFCVIIWEAHENNLSGWPFSTFKSRLWLYRTTYCLTPAWLWICRVLPSFDQPQQPLRSWHVPRHQQCTAFPRRKSGTQCLSDSWTQTQSSRQCSWQQTAFFRLEQTSSDSTLRANHWSIESGLGRLDGDRFHPPPTSITTWSDIRTSPHDYWANRRATVTVSGHHTNKERKILSLLIHSSIRRTHTWREP